MKEYIKVLKDVLRNGEFVENRTGVPTHTIFGAQMRFKLKDGFPAVTSKKLAWKAVVSELLWFMEGSTDERRLAEILYEKPRSELKDKSTIWTANADNQGKALGYPNDDMIKILGPVYGYQWRHWEDTDPNMYTTRHIDQLKEVIRQIKEEPDSRRIIMSAWNPAQLHMMALPPCHTMAQFKVINGKLSCQLYQRSADMFLGVPFNIASYSLLTHMLAQICGLEVGDFVWTGGDCHIYKNHNLGVQEQIRRKTHKLPTLKMPEFTSLEELLKTKTSDYLLENYVHESPIKADMVV